MGAASLTRRAHPRIPGKRDTPRPFRPAFKPLHPHERPGRLWWDRPQLDLPLNAVSWTKLGSAQTGPTISASTIPVTLTGNQAAGTILVVVAQCNSTTATFAFSDSRGGNSWATDATKTGVARSIGVGSCKPVNLLQTSDVVTCTFAGSVTDRAIVVYAVASLDQTTWFAGSNSANATTPSPDSGQKTGLTSGNSYAVLGSVSFNTAGVSLTAGTDGNGNALTKLDELTSGTAFHLATESSLALTGNTAYKATATITSAPWSALVTVYNVATGTTINKTPSGGIVLGGSAARTKTVAPVPSGGIVLGGSTTLSKTVAPSKSGGIVLGGSAAKTRTIAKAPSGGVVLGGSATRAKTVAPAPSGGIVLAGSATVSKSDSVAPTGGLVLGGSAAKTRTIARGPSGGIVLGGSAAEARTLARAPSGGIVLAGSATYSVLHGVVFTVSGGLVLGGSASYTVGPTPAGAGGVGGSGFPAGWLERMLSVKRRRRPDLSDEEFLELVALGLIRID